MTIIDRYILRLFIKVLFVSFVSLMGLFVVIDVFNNIDEFLNYGEKQGGVLRVIADYYGARVLMFFDKTNGLLSLVAAMFAITWLQRTNELTAIMAGGIPKIRVARPLIIAAVVVSVLGLLNRELLIPSVRHKLTRNAQDWLGEASRPLVPQFDNQTDILFAGRFTVAKEKKIDRPTFRLPNELSQFGRQIIASAAYYQASDGSRPSGYLLEGVEKPDNLTSLPSALLGETLVLLSPRDFDWLKPDQCFVVSDVDFDRLTDNSQWQQFSSTQELIRGFRNPSLAYGADTRVLVHARFVQPLLDIILLFLGLPLVLARESRNIFVSFGHCLGVVAAFFVVVLTCHGLGGNFLISPALAAWSPVMIFAPIATGLARPIWE